MSESEPINMDGLTDKQQQIVKASYDVDENTRNAIASQVDSHETYVGDVLKTYRPEYYNEYIADPSKSPVKSNGEDPDEYSTPADEKRHLEATYPIEMRFSEFEARMIGNRLWELAEEYQERENVHIEHELKWWSRRFMGEAKTREEE
jgi:hypothetical protein